MIPEPRDARRRRRPRRRPASALVGAGRARGLRVRAGDRFVGVVTRKTLVARGRRPRPGPAQRRRLGEIAEEPHWTIEARGPAEEAFRFMEEKDAERVPVVEDGRLVGVLSRERRSSDGWPRTSRRRPRAISSRCRRPAARRPRRAPAGLQRPRARCRGGCRARSTSSSSSAKYGAASRARSSPPATITGARSGWRPGSRAGAPQSGWAASRVELACDRLARRARWPWTARGRTRRGRASSAASVVIVPATPIALSTRRSSGGRSRERIARGAVAELAALASEGRIEGTARSAGPEPTSTLTATG